MGDPIQQWLEQADYDLDTAEDLFKSKRYIYAVFMLHLSIEKALKGLYNKKLGQVPPKVHNLIMLANRVELDLTDARRVFLTMLNDGSVATRYPEQIALILEQYPRQRVRELLDQGQEMLAWIKTQY